MGASVSGIFRHLFAFLITLLLLLLLSGCLLVSGEETTLDILEHTGNLSTTFVSAEGATERTVQVSSGPITLQVIVMVDVEAGDLQIDLLQPDGAVAFSLTSQPNTPLIRSSPVQSDDSGVVRYRVLARAARNGSYQIFFQP